MAANVLPSGLGDLFQLAEQAVGGLVLHGPWLIKGRAGQELGIVLERARTSENDFARSRLVKTEAADRFAAIDEQLTGWLAKARLVVMLAHGSKWSQSWVAAGFTHRGTNVPKRIKPRMELSRRLVKFFEDYPQYEVAFAGVTAAEARTMHEKINATNQQVHLATSDAAEKKQVRDVAEKLLRRELRLLRNFLPYTLKKNDRRWQDFGFKIPKPDFKPLVRHSPSTPHLVRMDFSSDKMTPAPESAVA